MSTVIGPRVHSLLASALGHQPEGMGFQATQRTLDRATELAIFPLVMRWLQHADVSMPASAVTRWREHNARALLLRHIIGQVTSTLRHMDHLFLKGEPLARALFSDGLARESIDIDLLVRPADVDACIAALSAVGLNPVAGSRPHPWVNHEFPLIHTTLSAMVEVHWGLALPRIPTRNMDDVLNERVTMHLDDDLAVPILSPSNVLMAACYHHHHHVGFFKGLLDIAAVLDRWGDSLDWSRIEKEAQELGVMGLLQWPLEAIAKLSHLPPPLPTPWNALAPRAWASASARATRGCLAQKKPYGGLELVAPKVEDVSRGGVMIWGTASMSLLDGQMARVRGILTPVFLGPKTLAQARGEARPGVGTWIHLAARPLILARKQLSDWTLRRDQS